MTTGCETIRLVPLEEAHIPALLQWNKDQDAAFLRQWAGDFVYTHPLTAVQVRGRLAEETTRFFAVLDDGEPVGAVELYAIDAAERTARVCRFLMREDCRGRGCGTRALELLCGYAARGLGLKRLYLGYFAYNEAAGRCYEKAGFVRDGVRENPDPLWNSILMKRELLPPREEQG